MGGAGVEGHAAKGIEGTRANLPTGVIVGTAIIAECRNANGHYEWHLSDVKRLPKPRRPKRQPQPVWFKPF